MSGTVPSSSLRLFFTQLWVTFLTFMCWFSLWEALSSVTLCYKLQWPWSPQSPPGPGWVPTSWDEAYKLSQESKLGKYWGLSSFVICLSGIRIFCCQIASLLKTIVSYASFFFYYQVGMYAGTGSFSRPESLKSCTLPEKDYFQKWPLTHSWEPSWECSDQSTFICLRSWAMLH